MPVPINGQYGANTNILPRWLSSPGPAPVKISAINSAASTYMIMDAGIFRMDPAFAATAVANTSYLPGMGEGGGNCNAMSTAPTANIDDCKSGRHFGGVNVGFADGHAKWLKSSVLVEQASHSATSSWNPAN